MAWDFFRQIGLYLNFMCCRTVLQSFSFCDSHCSHKIHWFVRLPINLSKFYVALWNKVLYDLFMIGTHFIVSSIEHQKQAE